MLTPNSLNMIFDGAKSPGFSPIVQIISITKKENFLRVIISDGEHFSQSVLSGSNNDEFVEFDIVTLSEYNVANINNVKVIIVSKMQKVQPFFEIIGSPNPLERKVQEDTQIIAYNLKEPEPVIPESQIDDDELYLPICALNLTSSDWTIKARIIEKSAVRSWDKPNSKGKLFDCILTDRKGDQIKGAFFNTAVDLFFDTIQEGCVYSFSGGNVRSSNKAYSSIPNDLEINFDKNSTIRKLQDDQKIPKISFNFIYIDYLPKLSINTTVDICAIVCEMSDTVKINSRNGGELVKRNLVVSDHTECSIEITLWNELAELPEFNTLDVGDRPILCFKNLKLKDFNKLSLSSERIASKVVFDSSGIKAAQFLQEWKNKKREICPNTPLTEKKERNAPLKTVSEIKAEWNNPLISNKTEYFRMIGVINKIQLSDEKPIWYQSCRRCKKKVLNDSYGNFNCESCGNCNAECDFRFICNLNISDCSGCIYATAFDDVMASLLEMSARDFHDLSLTNLSHAQTIAFSASCKYVSLLINCKDNEGSVPYKFTIKKLDKFNPASITKLLLKDLLMI